LRRPEPEPLALILISGWEFTALTTRKIPTVTNVTMRLPRGIRLLLVAATGWWLVDHFDIL
jgi:hypothetical protein